MINFNSINNNYLKAICIPISLIEYSLKEGLVKPLSIYVFLKFYSDGKVHAKSKLFTKLKEVFAKDNRTIKKHLQTLLNLDWIGFNPQSQYYFVRSFSRVKELSNIKISNGAVCYEKDLINLNSFFLGAIIEQTLRTHRYLRKRAQINVKAAAENRGVTIQPIHNSNSFPEYYGLSKSKIAQLMNCKATRATQLKHKASKDGFITVKHKFNLIKEFDTKELAHNAKNILQDSNMNFNNKLKVYPYEGKFNLVQQTFDEISTNIAIKRISRKSRLRKKPLIVKERRKDLISP